MNIYTEDFSNNRARINIDADTVVFESENGSKFRVSKDWGSIEISKVGGDDQIKVEPHAANVIIVK